MSPTPPGGEVSILEPGQARGTPSRPAGLGHVSSARSGSLGLTSRSGFPILHE